MHVQKIPARQLGSVSTRWGRGLRSVGSAWNHLATWRSRPAESALDIGDRLQRVEAILFLARDPLPSRKLSQYANLADGTEARTLVRRLNREYDAAGRAFRVEEVAGGYQLLSRAPFASWLRRLGHVPGETRLSAPAMETLAVVAYRQPVLRADVEAIRGVACGELLRQLMERDLVRIGGRSDELGRPYLYTTTKRFLQMFGLQSVDKLPRADGLRGPLPGLPADVSIAAGEEEKEPDVSVSLAVEETAELKTHPQSESSDESTAEPRQHDDDDDLDDDDDDLDDDYQDEEWEEVEEADDEDEDEDWDEDEEWGEDVEDEDEEDELN